MRPLRHDKRGHGGEPCRQGQGPETPVVREEDVRVGSTLAHEWLLAYATDDRLEEDAVMLSIQGWVRHG